MFHIQISPGYSLNQIHKKEKAALKEVGSMRYQPRYGNGMQGVDQKPRRAEMQKKLAFDDIWAANLAVPEPIEACVHSLIKRAVWEFASSPDRKSVV